MRATGISVVRRWLVILVSFALGLAAGLGLLGVRLLLHANADPLNDNWPLYLPATSFGASLACTLLTRRPITPTIGLYCGLVGFMLLTGACAYPVASAIALAVHGLLPASLGAVVSLILLHQSAISGTSESHPTDSSPK